MLLKDIVGQTEVKQRLLHMYAENRVPHAMLFAGPEGCGALPLAVAYAQYICCTGDKSHGDSCGECPSCLKFKKLAHPDFHQVFPIINATSTQTVSDDLLPKWREMFAAHNYFSTQQWFDFIGGKKQGIIGTNEAANIHKKLRLTPYESEKQMMLIWAPELMNESTSNKILKILEEPPANTIFMLVSEDFGAIIPTILSRVQRINMSPIDDDSMYAYVKERYNLPDDKARRVVHVSMGSVCRLESIITMDEGSQRNLEFFKDLMRSAYTSNVQKIEACAESLKSQSTETIKSMLVYSINMLRESFMYNLDNAALSYMTDEEEEFVCKFAQFVHVGNYVNLYNFLNNGLAEIEQNGSVRIIMTDLMFSMAGYLRMPRP